jgi:hypothetical protein
MRKIELTMPQFLAVCFIVIIINMNIHSYMQIRALDNIANLINESKQEQVVMTYEDKSELEIIVTYEKQEDGDMIYDFGDVSDEYYFYIIINEEQGIYEYYFPAMHIDWPIECDSLEDLQSVVMCHIEQAYPNARFVMNQK